MDPDIRTTALLHLGCVRVVQPPGMLPQPAADDPVQPSEAAIEAAMAAMVVERLSAAVDAAAEAARATMLTGGIGQALSYRQVGDEAAAILAAHAAGDPLPGDTVLSGLVGIEVDPDGNVCPDLVAVANVVAAEAATYRAVEKRINAVRRRAKIAIGKAADDAGRQAWHTWAVAALPLALAGDPLPDPPA